MKKNCNDFYKVESIFWYVFLIPEIVPVSQHFSYIPVLHHQISEDENQLVS